MDELKDIWWEGSSKDDLIYEIRINVDKNIYRSAYVTKFSGVVAVLHCWQKKTQQTSQADKELIVSRYRSARETLK